MPDLSLTGQNMGTNLITSLQMGDTATGRTYRRATTHGYSGAVAFASDGCIAEHDIDFDDVAVSPTSP